MVCSICKEAGHTAPSCKGVFVTETTIFLKKYWIPNGDITEDYDERVKTWAREARFGLPVWRRLWEEMDYVLRGGTINYGSLILLESQHIPHINFVRPAPRTVAGFKARIANYVRPNELPEVMQRIIELNTTTRAAWEADREEREARWAAEAVVREARQAARQAERQERLAIEAARQEENRRARREARALMVQEENLLMDTMRTMIRRIPGGAPRVVQTMRDRLLPRPVPAPAPAPKPKIQIQMEDNDASFFKENDCVCCMNPLNAGATVAFGCKHVTCAECAPKVIKMVAARCPTCREDISTIKFTRDMPTTTYNALFSAVM